MLLPRNEFINPQPTVSNRAFALSSVGLLHVLAIYALVSGMAGAIVKKYAPPDLQVTWLDTFTPPKTVPLPPQPKLTHPENITLPSVPIPVFRTNDPGGGGINVIPQMFPVPSVDSAAAGLGSTHTTPPYPLEAQLQSHQGTVLLAITVSPQGDVVAANVLRSSGYPELDEVAVSWVIAHWKYRPAHVDGMAVTSQTQAAVKFDLLKARH